MTVGLCLIYRLCHCICVDVHHIVSWIVSCGILANISSLQERKGDSGDEWRVSDQAEGNGGGKSILCKVQEKMKSECAGHIHHRSLFFFLHENFTWNSNPHYPSEVPEELKVGLDLLQLGVPGEEKTIWVPARYYSSGWLFFIERGSREWKSCLHALKLPVKVTRNMLRIFQGQLTDETVVVWKPMILWLWNYILQYHHPRRDWTLK